MNKCNCKNENFFKGKDVKEKTKLLQIIKEGPEFGRFIYKCEYCNQYWEENLSEATRYDWPPILKKVVG